MSFQAPSGGASSAPNQPKRVIPLADWEARMNAIPIKKGDLNRLVMDYLVIEGYKDAAESFVKEANLTPSIDLNSIENRMNIRNAVQSGQIEAAIEMVNDLDPEILDTNASLFFALQQQRLIEYIRQGNVQEALEFATEELAPRGEENPDFLTELERTMGLLALDQSALETSDLLSAQQRTKTASLLNAAILTAQSQPKDPKLPAIIRTVVWAQEQLVDRGVLTPQIKDLRTGRLEGVREELLPQSGLPPSASGNNPSANTSSARRSRRGNSGSENAMSMMRPAERERVGLTAGGEMDIVGS